MAKYDDFRDLQKVVKETWNSFEVLLEKFGWDFFSESGAIAAQGYEILDDAFQACNTKKEVAAYVANEISVIKNRIKNTENKERAAELRTIGNWLIGYSSVIFEEEIISDLPELNPYYLRGC